MVFSLYSMNAGSMREEAAIINANIFVEVQLYLSNGHSSNGIFIL